MTYDAIIVDTMNVAYRTFDFTKSEPELLEKKKVYKGLVAAFIAKIQELREEYSPYGEMYLLFDNPTSRIDLQSSFYFADRREAFAKYKRDREKAPKEFYNSINLLRYYYMVCPPDYKSVQIQRLEADDLVKPLLNHLGPGKTSLMITNDMDWTRYLSDNVYWMPRWGVVQSRFDLSQDMGFPISEETIVAYKSLFGDESDNIPSVIPPKYKKHFPMLIAEFPDAYRIIDASKEDSTVKRYPMLTGLRESEAEKQMRINMQLINAIEVAQSHFELALVSGRDSKISKRLVESAVGLEVADESFVFGNIKRPREG